MITVLALFGGPLLAQPRLAAQPDVTLGAASDQWHVEPWLAVHPHEPRRLFAAAISLGSAEHGRHDTIAFVSIDGGESWQQGRPADGPEGTDRGETYFPGGDPGLLALSNGAALLSTLGDDGSLRVWRSRDGQRYERLVDVPGGAWDRPFLIEAAMTSQPVPAKPPSNPNPPLGSSETAPTRIVATGKFPARLMFGPKFFGEALTTTDVLGIATSDDFGSSWSGPRITVPDPHHHLINSVGAPVYAANGDLLLPYFAFPPDGLRDGLVHGGVWLLSRKRSLPTRIGDWQVWANRGDLQLATLGLAIGGIALDRSSGPHGGRLYATWLTLVAERYQVVLAWSEDHGETWSAPRVVNDEAVATHHSNPGLAVSSAGTLGVVWNTHRQYERTQPPSSAATWCFETRFSASLDGGATFLPSLELSVAPACPPPRAENPQRPFRFLNGGETQGLAGLEGDTFQAVWIGAGKRPGDPWLPHATRVTVER